MEIEDQKLFFGKIDALRLYGGDVRERCSNGCIGSRSRDSIYGDEKAYRTLNALLFDGVKNEQERIWKEHHFLNPEFIRRIEETVQIYTDIFSLMKKKHAEFDECLVGKRIDRASSFNYYERGFTQSFFSCAKCDYDSCFTDKRGIVLVEMHFTSATPFIDYEKIVAREDYINLEEREILLPPFLNISLERIPFTAPETRRIRDLDNNPPVGKYRVKATGFPDYRIKIPDSEETLWRQIMKEKEVAAHALEKMNKREHVQDYKEYVRWKNNLQKYLKIQFSDIWYGGSEY